MVSTAEHWLQRPVQLYSPAQTLRDAARSDWDLAQLEFANSGRNRLQRRLGLQADVRLADAGDVGAWWRGERYDAVLLDAPCSASGIVSRHPDVRWSTSRDLVSAGAGGRLHLEVSDEELQARLAVWAETRQAIPADGSGYRKLYVEHVLQADEGCDFDFLVGCRGAEVPRHSH